MTVTARPRRFGGGPDSEELRRWVREGKTDAEIGEILGLRYNTDSASKQAVAYWRNKYQIGRGRAPLRDHSDVRPWRVSTKHVGDPIEHRLYAYSNRRQGVQLDPSTERLLDEFLADLTSRGAVVDYNRDTERGWLFRLRDEFDDPDNIIRHPDHP